MWYWLSFADPDLPKGQQFLGVAIVEVEADQPAPLLPRDPPDPKDRPFVAAVIKAHALGINPGGEVQGHLLREPPPEKYRYRLITKPEINEIGMSW